MARSLALLVFHNGIERRTVTRVVHKFALREFAEESARVPGLPISPLGILIGAITLAKSAIRHIIDETLPSPQVMRLPISKKKKEKIIIINLFSV
ncbi:hypothetical protein EVAR_10882_1 [Eumeta japonica]|uniref:Uncharacterized protein n=1 Tax=Eumeta variegata TaxID=151549 RepID=A0A4C1USU7_EUMVA|nr:hypothetical protein EVAR_10882_1 [Eumeta japonica]